MFNLGAIASNVLNSIDSAAKESLEEPTHKESATAIRQRRRETSGNGVSSSNQASISSNNNINSIQEDGSDEKVCFMETTTVGRPNTTLSLRLDYDRMISGSLLHTLYLIVMKLLVSLYPK